MWHKPRRYIYVLVRKDLPLADQMVQVGHACFESGMNFGQEGTHLILLQVENQKELNEFSETIKEHRIKYSMFFEPDPIIDGDTEPMGNTAICTEPISGSKREIFKNCSLWVPEK
jgi:hypothetical protein